MGIGRAFAFVLNQQGNQQPQVFPASRVRSASADAVASSNNMQLQREREKPPPRQSEAIGGGSSGSEEDFVIIDSIEKQGTTSRQQQPDVDAIMVANHIQLCEYVCSILTTISTVADTISREALQNEQKESVSALKGGASVSSSPPSLSPSFAQPSRSRGDSGDGAFVGSFDSACALYLHALNLLREYLQRTCTTSATLPNIQFYQVPMSKLKNYLITLFDQLLRRAEGCQERLAQLSVSIVLPAAEPLMYKAAMQLARDASVEELLGNLHRASSHYNSAKLLIESVLMTAHDPSDKRILQQLATTFSEQQNACDNHSIL